MDANPDCFVSGLLAVVLRISRFAGTAPLHFVRKKTGWRGRLSSSWSIYGYIMMVILTLCLFGTLISEMGMDNEKTVHMKTHTRRLVWIMQISLTTVTAGTVVYGAPKQMRCTIACLNQMQMINSKLNIHQWPIATKKKDIGVFIIWVITTLALAMSDYFQTIILTSRNDAEIWVAWMNLFYYFCYWIMLLHEMQFIMITLQVKRNFKAINDSLRRLLRDRTKKSTSRDDHENVHRLVQVYTSVCDVVRTVDRSHGMVVLMTLVSLVLHLVCTPYYLITNLLEYNSSQDLTWYMVDLVTQLFWCLFHTFNLVVIIEPCHLTHMEIETTRELVSDLMHCAHSTYDPVAVELEMFFRHLVLNEVSFKPLQVTTMTRALVITILGSITTYLVIIIQLGRT